MAVDYDYNPHRSGDTIKTLSQKEAIVFEELVVNNSKLEVEQAWVVPFSDFAVKEIHATNQGRNRDDTYKGEIYTPHDTNQEVSVSYHPKDKVLASLVTEARNIVRQQEKNATEIAQCTEKQTITSQDRKELFALIKGMQGYEVAERNETIVILRQDRNQQTILGSVTNTDNGEVEVALNPDFKKRIDGFIDTAKSQAKHTADQAPVFSDTMETVVLTSQSERDKFIRVLNDLPEKSMTNGAVNFKADRNTIYYERTTRVDFKLDRITDTQKIGSIELADNGQFRVTYPVDAEPIIFALEAAMETSKKMYLEDTEKLHKTRAESVRGNPDKPKFETTPQQQEGAMGAALALGGALILNNQLSSDEKHKKTTGEKKGITFGKVLTTALLATGLALAADAFLANGKYGRQVQTALSRG